MSLKVRDIQVWQPSMALALVPVAIMISSKKKRVMRLIFVYNSKSDNNFRKSVLICQIIDSVDNHFCVYL